MTEWPALDLRLIEFTSLDACLNMALDGHLLGLCETTPGQGFVRFYTWKRPSLSLGHNEHADVIDQAKARDDAVDIVRRPTGGRVVLHGDDLTYAVVLPVGIGKNLSDTYRLISEAIIEGLGTVGVPLELQRGTPGKSPAVPRPCFASVSRYEVTYEGKKVVGSAQRIGETALLQHGSIPLGQGYLKVVDYMNLAGGVKRRLKGEIEEATACLNGIAGRELDPEALASELAKAFANRLGCGLDRLSTSDFESEIAPLCQRLRAEFR